MNAPVTTKPAEFGLDVRPDRRPDRRRDPRHRTLGQPTAGDREGDPRRPPAPQGRVLPRPDRPRPTPSRRRSASCSARWSRTRRCRPPPAPAPSSTSTAAAASGPAPGTPTSPSSTPSRNLGPARRRGAGLGRRHALGQHGGGLRGAAGRPARARRQALGAALERLRLCRRPGERREDGLKRYNEVFTRTIYETEHPVVHVHPETGERSLLLGHFVQRILGSTSSDSRHLFRSSTTTSPGRRTRCAGAGGRATS